MVGIHVATRRFRLCHLEELHEALAAPDRRPGSASVALDPRRTSWWALQGAFRVCLRPCCPSSGGGVPRGFLQSVQERMGPPRPWRTAVVARDHSAYPGTLCSPIGGCGLCDLGTDTQVCCALHWGLTTCQAVMIGGAQRGPMGQLARHQLHECPPQQDTPASSMVVEDYGGNL